MPKGLPWLTFLLLVSVIRTLPCWAESEEELREKMERVEQRAATETELGRGMALLIEQQHTVYVLDEDIPGGAQYLFYDDRIHYRPIPLEEHREYLVHGEPMYLLQCFHEEIHSPFTA